jgi:signal recognition particle receptor subunit beta
MEQVKFAITGRSATGKSMFINTIRNFKPGDDDFAKAGSGNTTITPTLYMHPKIDQITFYDLPGYSTTKFKNTNYISEIKISHFDFFFIFLTTSWVKMRYGWFVNYVSWANRPLLSGQRSTQISKARFTMAKTRR